MPRYLFSYPKDDNDFRPNQRVQKQHKIVKKKQTKTYNKNGWDQDENRKYREFVQANTQLLMNREKRREKKVFLRLSQHVDTRDANQCRSHHQKMMQKYKTIDKVLQFLRYLQDKGEPMHKKTSTCQMPTLNDLDQIGNQAQDLGLIFDLNDEKDSLYGMFQDNQIDNYFNFMQDDIWLK